MTSSAHGCDRRVVSTMVAALFMLVWGAVAMAQEDAAPKRGDVAFEANFDTEEDRKGWSTAPWAEWVTGYEGTTSLRVTVPAEDAAENRMIVLPIDLTRYRGSRLAVECMAKADDVSKPPQPYLGVKCMLHYKSETSGPYWSNQNNVFGTFDWKKLRFVAPIAEDATGGQLALGLQASSGTVWFDELRITVAWPPPPARPEAAMNAGPVYKGHDLPRLRGVMSPNAFVDEDMRVLGQEWNANLIRWQMTRRWGVPNTDRDLDEYDQWIGSELDDLEKALEACNRYGIKVVVDLHSPPGGRYENREMAIFHEAKYQDHFVKVWERIATRFKGNPAVWGYDLVNEPVQADTSTEGVPDYLGAQVRAAKAIRAIDPDVPIIFEVDQWDSAPGFRYLEPVDVPNVIYQVHMYWPGGFTHQGVHSNPVGVKYPGMIGGMMVDKEALRRHLQPVRDFQLAFNVHIYVGEFSAARWAPGAAQYLSDCIDIFEEYGWDWSYHAYREWDGWSLEHGPDPNDHARTAEPSDRMQVLLGWFAKNEKPPVK